MSRIALFAYGSLVDPASASRTLGRPVEAVAPARLGGWRRRWSQARDNLSCEKTFTRVEGGDPPRWVLGLNIEPDAESGGGPNDAGEGPKGAGEGPNGALIEVGEADLDRLDLREIRYDRVDVTELVELAIDPAGTAQGRFERIVAYTAKPAHFAAEPPPGAVILASYAAAVEGAFAALGETERRLYIETTGPHPVEVVEATLVRDRIPPGNPTEW